MARVNSHLVIGVYRDDRSNDITWVSAEAFNYSREHIRWVLPYWGDLKAYRWPQCPLEDVPSDHQPSTGSLFERVVAVKVELDRRMGTTERDGQMLLDRYYRGKSDRDMRLTYAPLPLDEVDRSVDRVLGYISGRSKARSYAEWRMHKPRNSPEVLEF